jgi:hypothetical protein
MIISILKRTLKIYGKGALEVLFGTKGSFCTETIRNHSVAGELDWLAGKYQIGFIEFHSSLLPQRVDYSD